MKTKTRAVPKPSRKKLPALAEPPELERYSTLRRLAADPGRRFVVALGGGCVPGLCGNAALVELIEELGLKEHVAEVWGTSSGALIGGAWASGTSAQEIMAQLHGFQRKRMVDTPWVRVVIGFALGRVGCCAPDAVIRGEHFHRELVAGLTARTFEECPLPFRCIACVEEPGMRRKVFREGPLAPAISASIALPGLLLPRDETGRPTYGFYDGGLVEKTPLFSPIADHTALGDGRELLIVGTHFANDAHRIAGAHGFIERFMVTIDSLEERLWEYQRDEARKKHGVSVLMLNPCMDDPTSFDFKRIDHDCQQARAAFRDQLQNGKIAMTLGAT
jgi:predicted acylesterase/phospholipase RssA